MTIDALGKSVGMEKYTEQQIVRNQYAKASKLVHGDSLLTLLAYNLDENGMQPKAFAPAMEVFRAQAIAAPCPLFIALLSSVDCGLMVGFGDELETLNNVWRQVWREITGTDVDVVLRNLNEQQKS
jgi:hypothetical protein